ncbi:type II toxin-antitoxin system VapC family toxin [bacterium]|jgi:PIN domain nuclease of toxin-antitoxin system|nr:type II toxin-antitoxin system VapC family toxin [bacterium]MDA7645019.1 type II toxin-antitoxin system VapC family toxin [bacterium]MDA7667369.1 type II toxin-antitoxin system VapC family toxin [bacterium]
MTYLLDTHVILWMIEDPDQLGKRARIAIENGENQLLWSAVSFWELTVKISLGKLKLQSDWIPVLDQEKKSNRIKDLPIEWRHCQHQLALPWHHRDPFDRILVCQAIEEKATLITKDRNIKRYPVKTIW